MALDSRNYYRLPHLDPPSMLLKKAGCQLRLQLSMILSWCQAMMKITSTWILELSQGLFTASIDQRSKTHLSHLITPKLSANTDSRQNLTWASMFVKWRSSAYTIKQTSFRWSRRMWHQDSRAWATILVNISAVGRLPVPKRETTIITELVPTHRIVRWTNLRSTSIVNRSAPAQWT